jgi:NodT family efflux transporter outer membrane factor (OMF) lipoprotein
MIKTIASILVMTLTLGACVVGPDYHRPDTVVPAHWSGDQGSFDSVGSLNSWWQSFHDPVLSRLMTEAVANNYDLKIAGKRILAARDQVRIAASGDLPTIGIGGAAENRRQTQTLDWPPPASAGDYRYWQLGFDASWELDLFGETTRRKESAQAAVGASVDAQHGILVSLMAAVATDYVSYRATAVRLRIAQENLETARKAQQLVHHAYQSGERSHIDVSKADARVHAVEAAIPRLQAQSDNLLHALAILLGQTPEQFGGDAVQGGTSIPVPPPLPVSLPSEVIARRPDIRRAEHEYAGATANVGVAVASLYPHFAIPLGFGFTTSSLHQAFRVASLAWEVGLSGTQTLYTGGRLSAKVDAARVDKDAALLAYQQTVLRAFAEVEDALSDQAAEQTRYASIGGQLADDRQAVDEAQRRYSEGEVGFLPVLDSQTQLHVTQDAEAESALARCLASIALYKALGGGWEGVALPDGMKEGTKTAQQ